MAYGDWAPSANHLCAAKGAAYNRVEGRHYGTFLVRFDLARLLQRVWRLAGDTHSRGLGGHNAARRLQIKSVPAMGVTR